MPTIPPGQPPKELPEDQPAQRMATLADNVVKHYGWTKPVAIALAAAFVLGTSWALWQARLASKDDVAESRAAAATALTQFQASTQAQIASFQIELQRQRERAISVETDVTWIKGALWELVQRTPGTHTPAPPP